MVSSTYNLIPIYHGAALDRVLDTTHDSQLLIPAPPPKYLASFCQEAKLKRLLSLVPTPEFSGIDIRKAKPKP